MKDTKKLNDQELEKVTGGEIESSNIIGYDHSDLSPLKSNGLNRAKEEYEDR